MGRKDSQVYSLWFVVYSVSLGISIELLLCHTLVRSVHYSAFLSTPNCYFIYYRSASPASGGQWAFFLTD